MNPNKHAQTPTKPNLQDKCGFTNGFCQNVCHAGCCGPMVFDMQTLEKYKNLIPADATWIQTHDGKFLLFTHEGRCVFVGKDHKCKIYPDRPQVCRDFGTTKTENPILKCPYLKRNGSKRKKSDTKKLFDIINKRITQHYKVSKEIKERESCK